MSDVHEINDPQDVFSQITPVYDIARSATPDRVAEPGYYGLPILKRPFWKWEIAGYFFFEGISAGAYVLSSIASLSADQRLKPMVRSGRILALAALLPCPPLLIADLGRPERFLHMLRIFKKTSPMNHGAWALSGFGIAAGALFTHVLPASRLPFGGGLLRLLQRLLPARVIAMLGLPFAITMVSYPGVLLETTANPLWAHTNFLGPLFACSSMSSGAAALALANAGNPDHHLHRRLTRFEDIASAGEAAALALYVKSAGKAARPLTHGKQSGLFVFGAVALGILAPAILRRSKSTVLSSVVAPLMTLAGSLALKWSITYAGQESALDYELASRNSQTPQDKPFWGPADQQLPRFVPPARAHDPMPPATGGAPFSAEQEQDADELSGESV